MFCSFEDRVRNDSSRNYARKNNHWRCRYYKPFKNKRRKCRMSVSHKLLVCLHAHKVEHIGVFIKGFVSLPRKFDVLLGPFPDAITWANLALISSFSEMRSGRLNDQSPWLEELGRRRSHISAVVFARSLTPLFFPFLPCQDLHSKVNFTCWVPLLGTVYAVWTHTAP